MNSAVSNQPAHAAKATIAQAIRLRQLLAAIGVCFVVISIGCNADPSCRRETALLRAEILDIEDKYAVLQSKYESTATELHQYTGAPIDQTMYGATSNYHDVILNQEIISHGEIIADNGSYPGYVESYPSEQVIYGNPVQSYPQGSGIIVEGPAVQLGTPYNQETITTPSQGFGTPVNGGIIDEPIGEGNLDPSGSPFAPPSQNENSLPLPSDTSNQRGINPDDFELELPGHNRRSTPALQASTTLNRRRTNKTKPVTEIMVNRTMTSGEDVDNSPGDEGLNLLLQTRDANGQIVLQGGELTVSLIDPKQRQRIGFWRFLPSETELFFVDKDQDTDGILLHLPWDESVPRRSRLLVHVQFVTIDGRTLTTSSDVLIKPPTSDYSPEDPQVINWTQSDALWGDSDGGGYVTTEVDSLEDSFRVEELQRAEEAWQADGTYKRGARFSQSNDRDLRGRQRDEARVTEAVDNPDQPKWRPVR